MVSGGPLFVLREFLMPLPHGHRVLRFSLCIFFFLFASHCRSPRSVWQCLFSFTVNFAETWHMSLTEDLSASCSRWSETDLKQKLTWERFVSGPYLNICCLPSCLARSSLPSATPGAWLAGSGGGHPQPRNTTARVRVREELAVLNTASACA